MIGTEVILTLVLTRVLLPIIILLVIGEWSRQREANYWSRS
ncbi:MAG TPA: hypothetical protein VIV15_10025 [Anaerolineales bacterium]